MIFPINSNFWFLGFDGCALASRGANVIELCRAELSICSRDAFSLVVKSLPDSAQLKYDITVGKYRDESSFNCSVIYQGRSKDFSNVSLRSFSNAYLLGRCGAGTSFAYGYKDLQYSEFPKEDSIFFAVDGLVFVKSRHGGLQTVRIYNMDGIVLDAFEYQFSSRVRAADDAFKVSDKVFINCSGFESGGLLHCFCLNERKLLPPISLDSYMGAMCNLVNDFFYIDGKSLRRFNFESPHDSEVLAELPPLPGPTRGADRGQEWLWCDGTLLYVASLFGGCIWSYDLSGNLLHEQKVPDCWRIWHVNKEHVETGQNIVHLTPTSHEWGFDAVLSWLPGDFSNESLMQIESIESVEVEQIPSKKDKHGFRMIAQDTNGERVTRHAMHHFARLANKVAPSLMNGGKVNDKNFNGVFELILKTPDRQVIEQVFIDYVIECFEQMRVPMQNHRAGNKRDPLTLKFFWQAIAGGDMELLYDSEAAAE